MGPPPANALMRVIRLKLLREFRQRHPDSERPLRPWYKTVLQADWKTLQDVRTLYPHADGVADDKETLTVFNIGGNKYRLIARYGTIID